MNAIGSPTDSTPGGPPKQMSPPSITRNCMGSTGPELQGTSPAKGRVASATRPPPWSAAAATGCVGMTAMATATSTKLLTFANVLAWRYMFPPRGECLRLWQHADLLGVQSTNCPLLRIESLAWEDHVLHSCGPVVRSICRGSAADGAVPAPCGRDDSLVGSKAGGGRRICRCERRRRGGGGLSRVTRRGAMLNSPAALAASCIRGALPRKPGDVRADPWRLPPAQVADLISAPAPPVWLG